MRSCCMRMGESVEWYEVNSSPPDKSRRVPTSVSVFKGLPHGYRRFGDKLTASRAWDKVMHEGIRWALGRPSLPTEQRIHVYSDSPTED